LSFLFPFPANFFKRKNGKKESQKSATTISGKAKNYKSRRVDGAGGHYAFELRGGCDIRSLFIRFVEKGFLKQRF